MGYGLSSFCGFALDTPTASVIQCFAQFNSRMAVNGSSKSVFSELGMVQA